jgi:hypothetical protein
MVLVAASPLFALIQGGLGCLITDSEDDELRVIVVAILSISLSRSPLFSLLEEPLSPAVQLEITKDVMSCLELVWNKTKPF